MLPLIAQITSFALLSKLNLGIMSHISYCCQSCFLLHIFPSLWIQIGLVFIWKFVFFARDACCYHGMKFWGFELVCSSYCYQECPQLVAIVLYLYSQLNSTSNTSLCFGLSKCICSFLTNCFKIAPTLLCTHFPCIDSK